jgi:cyclic AMP-dependent transcription factor ATF-2
MGTPSFFADCVDFDDNASSYPDSFGDDRNAAAATTPDQSFPMYDGKMAHGDVPFGAVSKHPEPSKLGIWNSTVTTTELLESDMVDTMPQQMFVQPRTFLTEHDSMPTMALRSVSSKNKTPSTTPELQPSSRRTSSIKSERSSAKSTLDDLTDVTPPDPSPPKRRRTTKKSKKEAAANAEDVKRNKFLERNRIAASKCREKKKMFVSELEETKVRLETQHSRLQLEYNSLLGEVSELKHTLMTHAKCDDPNIDSWIANEARKFVQTSQLFGKNPYAGLEDNGTTPTPTGNGAGISHSRNSSIASSVVRHGAGGGYGSFSSVNSTNTAGTGNRRDSIAYSQGTSAFGYRSENNSHTTTDTNPAYATTASEPQTSPSDPLFPPLDSPLTLSRDGGMNFDHMPDDMFGSAQ